MFAGIWFTAGDAHVAGIVAAILVVLTILLDADAERLPTCCLDSFG